MQIIRIANEAARNLALMQIQALSLEPVMQVEIKRFVKKRNNGQNSFQWVGMLADFSEQGVFDGRTFGVKVWHDYLKEKFLPESYEEGITLKGYVKWQEMPDGSLRCIGSTTKLTTKGFSEYMERCYSYGSQELEIRFTASTNEVIHYG